MPTTDATRCEGSSTVSPDVSTLALEASWRGSCPVCGASFELGYAGFLPEHYAPTADFPGGMVGSKPRSHLTIGERIRGRRDELGMSQGALATSGISRTYISLVERNMRNPSAKALRALAPVLGVSPYWLETGEMAPAEELAQIVLSQSGNGLSPRSRALARRILTPESPG